MESYCSLCTFKVPQGANNLILCTLDTIHRLFFVTRLIINKDNGARPIVFKEWRDTRTFTNLKSTHCTLLILLIINIVAKKVCV
jgi:hypothetical protein